VSRDLDMAVAKVVGWTFPEGGLDEFGIDPRTSMHNFVPLYSESVEVAVELLGMFPSSVTSPKSNSPEQWVCAVSGVSASAPTFAEAVARAAVAAYGRK